MQAHEIDERSGHRAELLEHKLRDAVSRARGWEFDLPGTAELRRAAELFVCLGRQDLHLEGVHVLVARDGAISVATSNGRRTATFEIEPGGETSIVVSDEVAKALVVSASNPSDAEVVKEFRRAA